MSDLDLKHEDEGEEGVLPYQREISLRTISAISVDIINSVTFCYETSLNNALLSREA